ncbi:cell division control protein 6 homolog [Tetranychus urticae]|uniref:Cell division control protein n=1 Tax=Tetranychus urticae TaxID=32264 RepID=T1K646_TETUR|nr:cell division control protein 6 homolog [Tetranychus urticae]
MVVETRNRSLKRHKPEDSPIKAPVTRKRSNVTPIKRRVARNLLDEFNGYDDSPPPSPEPDIYMDTFISSPPITNPIAEAKRLLSIGAVDGIVGRDKEITELSGFLEDCILEHESSTIFVSGPPGTGKSMSVLSIVSKLSNQYTLTILPYNSMDFRKGTMIYSKIAKDLGIKDSTRYRDKIIGSIENYIIASKKMVILIIDEIDKLDKDLVDTMLDWPRAKKSKLILIGIANTITSSSLTKMCSFEMNCVKKVSFRPYSKDQLVDIIQSRLKYLSKTCDLISKPALDLCARKVSSYSGDARKALDICRQAIEMAEREKYSYQLGLTATADDGNNMGSPRKSPRMSPRMTSRMSPKMSPRLGIRRSPRKENFDKPLVEPRHIISILNSVFGNKLFKEESVADLTLHQQVILCCILCYGKEKKNKEIVIPMLYRLFVKACDKCKITSTLISNSDFLCICQILESLGLVRIKQAREMRLTKISLSVNEDEVAQRLAEKSLIKNLMNQIPLIL